MALKVYLAGPIQHADDNGVSWREEIKQEFSDSEYLEWLDPLDKYNSATDAQYVPRSEWDEYDDLQNLVTAEEIVEPDKEMIDESDAMLVGWSEVPACGTPMEVMYQYMLNEITETHKPIVVWWRDADDAESHISPWMEYHSTDIEDSRAAALSQLRVYAIMSGNYGTAENPWTEEQINEFVEDAET